ncbi:hypothetical protein BC936DRAFT_141701 [Jimgerdemannia flammicorona]|uniref:Uncharacterized protein n=1 Tax=Jimgerdemannia flammicorona TaxID=994334 RepID=A0A433A1T1_9FUNG|nr:hypothetical protein BC936DRAFT_141701 [Jimgerdemannia flammicorona]
MIVELSSYCERVLAGHAHNVFLFLVLFVSIFLSFFTLLTLKLHVCIFHSPQSFLAQFLPILSFRGLETTQFFPLPYLTLDTPFVTKPLIPRNCAKSAFIDLP